MKRILRTLGTSTFWAMGSFIFAFLALIFLWLSGLYISHRPEPEMLYLGLFIQFLAICIFCGFLFSIFQNRETRNHLNNILRRPKS